MEYVRFGNTGMKVSRLCLGTMTYGKPNERWQWALNEEQSRPFIRKAVELGINFFDTADVYSLGASEEVVGAALSRKLTQDEIAQLEELYQPHTVRGHI
jgi:aryl-alcohol dehydrogenase-like predicted oxidoreductase